MSFVEIHHLKNNMGWHLLTWWWKCKKKMHIEYIYKKKTKTEHFSRDKTEKCELISTPVEFIHWLRKLTLQYKWKHLLYIVWWSCRLCMKLKKFSAQCWWAAGLTCGCAWGRPSLPAVRSHRSPCESAGFSGLWLICCLMLIDRSSWWSAHDPHGR